MLVKKDKELIEQYTIDASNYIGDAQIVLIPESYLELSNILKQMSDSKTPVTFSGAGTGLTGGRVANGGVVISAEKFDRILDINESNSTITVQPYISVGDLAKELESRGYLYPPNPTEKTASIGGNISTNASGARTYYYGPTRNFIYGLKVILSNGETSIFTRDDQFFDGDYIEFNSIEGNRYRASKPTYKMPNTKHSAGYFSKPSMQAIDLFIGAEGTLGFIAEATLKYIPKPENTAGFIVFFKDMNSVFKYVKTLQGFKNKNFGKSYEEIKNVNPRLIEFFDDDSLDLLREKYPQIPEDARAAIWTEQEINAHIEDEVLNSWLEMIVNHSELSDETWTALTPSEHENFREFRHTLPENVYEIIARNNQHKVGIDAAVPDEHLESLYKEIVNSVNKYALKKVIYGHIGNNHLHANVFFTNEAERENAYKFYEEIIECAIKYKGTVSAEHGIGKLKTKYLRQMFGDDAIAKMRAIKSAIDPAGILNQGNLF
jgi:D-lactate dehydrogenase (cytochrome)